MAFTIEIGRTAAAEVRKLRAFDQRRILDEIETQLAFEPTKTTRNRKQLLGVTPAFDHVPPVWELRVDEFRVFYDVDLEIETVYVRAVRRKKPEQKTEEIIS